MRKALLLFSLALFFGAAATHAATFGLLRGIVHDPEHRPISGAQIALQAGHSDLKFAAVSNHDGEFTLPDVPIGDYNITISQPGFATLHETVSVTSGSALTLHFMLTVASVNESVTVEAGANVANVNSVTPTTELDRVDIARTPGADRTNSLAMITDFVPGAYVSHDMLHVRGGHQLGWLIDGVAIPNTNIA
ncbi:MAG TPA: carboxypeptidase-like regulatory domain-containing protein, partial [Acidobacteriaceae bacterium]|nr:carboxypeptidase-like regulatory domain-containing protein [Acidobacteriaceae bacterium]